MAIVRFAFFGALFVLIFSMRTDELDIAGLPVSSTSVCSGPLQATCQVYEVPNQWGELATHHSTSNVPRCQKHCQCRCKTTQPPAPHRPSGRPHHRLCCARGCAPASTSCDVRGCAPACDPGSRRDRRTSWGSGPGTAHGGAPSGSPPRGRAGQGAPAPHGEPPADKATTRLMSISGLDMTVAEQHEQKHSPRLRRLCKMGHHVLGTPG